MDAFPRAMMETLRRRAFLLGEARQFFLRRGYWEVETPILSAESCVDAHLDPLVVMIAGRAYYLQTSPEFAMKRMLAAGSGSIFQIGHVLRGKEAGRWHNTEFTMIEWYKVGGDLAGLMSEVGDFVSHLAGRLAVTRISYREAFRARLGMDPLRASEKELREEAEKRGLVGARDERAELLNFLWAEGVEPTLGSDGPVMVFDYPPMMAALAKRTRDAEGDLVAERFEMYWRGVELCNGYHELLDAEELRVRFTEQNGLRVARGEREIPVETRFLQAMEGGLPACAGVALGFDRLVALILGLDSVAEVLAFPWERA